MIDYEQTIEKIINSLTNITFEFDIETAKKEMVLEEVPKSELEKLGDSKIRENFNKGLFKIKMPNGNLIDAKSIYKHSIENEIKKPVVFINPNFKYVQWVAKKDFIRPQIKNKIKNQLTNNSDINFAEVQKALLEEEMKNKRIEGYIDKLPIKTSNLISKGKFHIQASYSRESAIEMVYEVIEELKKDVKTYIRDKFRKDYKYTLIYFIFIIFVIILWFISKQCKTLPILLSNTIAILLFFVSLVVLRLIKLSFLDTLLFKKKAKKKYEKEFYNNLN